ncbi:MAG: 2-oxo acid dehydrogenase subunit E2 [Tissierellia bacterium]|nr:2-oxo acid dehydrogenase subunit E2 [Tissierellia bacterium]HKM00863.1 2-oxo acid dehydrogenase subunit E2 [Sedimentibacter sp.]
MKRSDGYLLKDLHPFMKIIPYIMEKRSDSQNFSKQIFPAESIDKYISEKKQSGYSFSYMHVFIAAYVRLLAERPQLNRFVMNKQIYQRNKIYVSMAVKRSLRDDGEETTVKFEFTGKENIFEIAEIIDKNIAQALSFNESNDTDKLAEMVMSMPGFVKKTLVGIIKTMDKYNMLPKSVIDASPFHTTLFFTYLKSIDTNYIYHHLYDFGTTGIFAALGKTVKMPIVENDQVVVKKCCQIGYTMDERICDGVYYARSFKLLEKYFYNPQLLESEPIKKVKKQAV